MKRTYHSIQNYHFQITLLKKVHGNDIEERNIKLEIVNINKFYNGANELDKNSLRKTIDEIKPSIILTSVCYSESLDLRFVLEMEGIFPKLRLEQDLLLATKGKQVQLDQTQKDLLYKMSDPENIEKIVVIHGPEGSGKSMLGLEIVKMKVSHYLRKDGLKAGKNDRIRVLICGTYTGQNRVSILLKQMYDETPDIRDLCVVQFKPIEDVQLSNVDSFKAHFEEILKEDGKEYAQTIVMLDELFPQFKTNDWAQFKGISNVDFVFALRHAFNDGLVVGRLQKLLFRGRDFQDIMEKQGVFDINGVLFCHLIMSYRCNKQLIELGYHMLIHASKKEKMYKVKSFNHLPNSFPGETPLWVEVANVGVFIQFACTDKVLKDANDVMLVHESNNDDKAFKSLRRHCLEKKWKITSISSVMGSEASVVILYNIEKIDFEALSRAVNQLIFVTLSNAK